MSWNDAFNDPQQDLFSGVDPLTGACTVTVGTGTPIILGGVNDTNISWTNYNHNYNTAPYNVKTQLDTYITVGEEKLDERMLKRWRIFWEIMENDPKFADVIKDIETQIAFETLGKDDDE